MGTKYPPMKQTDQRDSLKQMIIHRAKKLAKNK